MVDKQNQETLNHYTTRAKHKLLKDMRLSNTIKIFLGSSITELKDERRNICDSITQDIRNLFGNDNVATLFYKCEDLHEGNIGEPDQNKIDKLIMGCDVSVFLFKTKAGEKTIHEYDVAKSLQKIQKHEIYVYFFQVDETSKTIELEEFQHRLKDEGTYWIECESLGDVKYDLENGLLKRLGIEHDDSFNVSDEIKKSGDELINRFEKENRLQEQRKMQVHQEIDYLLEQIAVVMSNQSNSIAAKIIQVGGIYRKADLWASKTDYKEEKHIQLLSDYGKFLCEYGIYNDAKVAYLRQLALIEKNHGLDNHLTAISCNNLGLVYRQLGIYDKAEEYYKRALKTYKATTNNDPSHIATCYNNIGLVYANQGNYYKAIRYYKKALRIEKNLDTTNANIAATYNSIGLVYYEKGFWTKALKFYNKALEIDIKILSEKHQNTATAYNNIGSVYKRKGDLFKANGYYEKALKIDEEVLGTNNPNTARDYNNIGLIKKCQSDFNTALEYLMKSKDIYEAILGLGHPALATPYSNIGLVLWNKGDHAQAFDYYLKSLEIIEKTLGTEHHDTAVIYNNLGTLYFNDHAYSEAYNYFEKALKIFKSIRHPRTRDTQKWLDATIAAIKTES